MVGKLLIALVMIVNAASMYLISITGLGVSVCIKFTVTEHPLRIGGKGTIQDGLSAALSPDDWPCRAYI